MRKFFKNIVMVMILGIAVITFAFVGITSNTLTGIAPGTVVAAGSRSVNQVEFTAIVQNYLRSLEQERGQRMTVEEAAQQGLDVQLLQELATQESTMAIFDALGLKPSLALIRDRLREQQAFFDPVTGRFDPQAYRQTLADNDLTVPQYEKQLADAIAREQLFSALGAGMQAPTTFAALEAIRGSQLRDARYFWVMPTNVEPVGEPTDAELQAYIDAQGVRTPERRAMTVVRFSTAKVLENIQVDEEQIERLVTFRSQESATPETRTIIQIPAKDSVTAGTIATRLRNGDDPRAVADAVGSTVVRHESKPRTALPDRAIAEAAFALENGAVSGPVQGDLGLAVLKVTAINPGVTPDPAQIRQTAQAEARQMAASARISEMADQLLTAVEAGEDLNTVAQRVGAELLVVPPIAQNGRTAAGDLVPGLTPAVAQMAFQTPEGDVSDVSQEGQGEFFAVRVDRIEPAASPAVDQVRAELSNDWKLQTLVERMQAKASELATRLRQGETLEAVAASIGAPIQSQADISQVSAQALSQTVPGPLLGAVINGKRGDTISAMAPIPPPDPSLAPIPRLFVGKIEDVSPGDLQETAQLAQRAQAGVLQALQDQMGQQFGLSSRAAIEPKIYPERARRGLGIEEPAAPRAGEAAEK